MQQNTECSISVTCRAAHVQTCECSSSPHHIAPSHRLPVRQHVRATQTRLPQVTHFAKRAREQRRADQGGRHLPRQQRFRVRAHGRQIHRRRCARARSERAPAPHRWQRAVTHLWTVPAAAWRLHSARAPVPRSRRPAGAADPASMSPRGSRDPKTAARQSHTSENTPHNRPMQ